MADYPPTPPFGMTPSHTVRTYRDTPRDSVYEYGDVRSKEPSLLEYHKAQASAAFQNNASNIPEFSPTAVASGIPPLPIYRDHDPPHYPYMREPSGQARRFEAVGSQNSPAKVSTPSSHQPVRFIPPPPAWEDGGEISNTPEALAAEEGELSEGEFQEVHPALDLNGSRVLERDIQYERQGATRPAAAHRADTAYPAASQVPLTDMYGRSLNRQRSGSYSPYGVPNEVEYETYPDREKISDRRQFSKQARPDSRDRFEYFPSKMELDQSPYDELPPGFPRRAVPYPRESIPSPTPVANPQNVGSDTTKSVAHARKEAQNAILNLLPLKVQFLDYIVEGIDEEIVRRQFEKLGIPPFSSQIPANMPKLGDNVAEPHDQHQDLPLSGKWGITRSANEPVPNLSGEGHQHETSALKSSTTTDIVPSTNNSHAGEERKDRIARLLAEKKKKQASPVMQVEPSNSASPEATISIKSVPNAHSLAKADKERLLRQKMEALQKSREQRAQKAASKTSTTTDAMANAQKKESPQPASAQASRSSPHIHRAIQPEAEKSTSPDQSLNNSQQMPSIPGLFLATASENLRPTANDGAAHNVAPLSIQRKRPVASDFDTSPPAAIAYKRPFGQSRNEQRLVIDVSDDESENDELGGVQDDHLGNTMANRMVRNGTNTQSLRTTRDLPLPSEHNPWKTFTTPTSGISTPPSLQPAARLAVSRPEDLQRKEQEIQEMRRKIAEAERRKKAKQNLSGSQTPGSNGSTSSPAKTGNIGSTGDKAESATDIESLIDNASRQVDDNQQKLALAVTAEEANEKELRRSETERRKQLRAKIASDLPAVDAEVEKAQRKLADLRAEMAKMEAAIQQGLEEKRRLAEEMDKLSPEAEEPPQVESDKVDGPRSEAAAPRQGPGRTTAHPPRIVPEAITDTNDDISIAPHALAQKTSGDGQDKNSPSAPEHTVHRSPPLGTPEEFPTVISPVFPPVAAEVPMRPASRTSVSSRGGPAGIDRRGGSASDLNPDRALEAALQDASARDEAETRSDSGSDVEMADSYTPDPNVLAPASAPSPAGKSEPDGLNSMVDEFSNLADGESDTYEPPEATPPATASVMSLDSPPFSPAPPEADSDSSHTNVQHGNPASASDGMASNPTSSHVEDISLPSEPANEVFSVALNDLGVGQLTTEQSDSASERRTNLYTPYESPLKKFRAYRFHPAFEKEVSGGFKSLTYSNKIKDNQELCRYESAGGVCNDASCEFQHFRDMGLADDTILVELGNSAGYTEEEKPRFVAGLRTVLQGLRSQRTKDFQVIASEIAAYRARFLGDSSRILLLSGASI